MLRVLVVDDSVSFAEFVKDLLEDKGFFVETACSGESAIKILRKNGKFDLVITDFVMGEINGCKLIQSIKKKYPQIKTILMSSDFMDEILAHLPKDCCPYDYFLYKGHLGDSPEPLYKILKPLGLTVKKSADSK